MEAIRKAPLFYAAIVFCVIVLCLSSFPEKLPAGDISIRIGKDRTPVFLGGMVVSEVDTRQSRYGDELVTFDLKAKEISEEETGQPSRVTGKVKVYLRNPDKKLQYGDEVLIKGELRSPKGVRNPGGFDQKAYLERQGIRSLFYGDTHTPPRILNRQRGNPVFLSAIKVKHFLSQSLAQAFNRRDAGFLKALFLGERRDLDEDFKDLFIKTGTMHILAVSGFNIGFLSLTFFFLLKPFRISRNIKLCLTLVLIWLYCLLVGWQAPVVRASVMATVLIASQLLGRRPNVLNSLGLAALVILMVNSRQLFDVGFQLSFVAVLAIAQVLPVFFRRPELWPNEKWTVREKARHYLEELFWVSFVCLIATLPITVQNFYIVTPLSLLANMIVVPLSFLIFFMGILFFLTFWWVPAGFSLVPWAIQWAMKFFIEALFVVENLPGAYWTVGKLNPFLWTGLVAGLLFLLWDRRIANALLRAAALVLLILNIFLFQNLARYFHHEFKMTALDVGEGDSLFFEFPKGGNLLVDAGKGGDGDRGRRVVAPFLRSKGIRGIDALVMTHPQEDHIGGVPVILDEFGVRNIFDAGRDYPTLAFHLVQEKIRDRGPAYFRATRGSRIEGYEDIQIQVLHPPEAQYQDERVNDQSVVLRIGYGDIRFLLTGDVEKSAMANLLDTGQELKADVLKVPHHGSRLGSVGAQFVREVNPRISVISVGDHNPFHHPSADTLRALASIPGNRVYRTDLDRAVEIVSDGKNVMVKFWNAD